MAKTPNIKYVEVTADIMSDERFNPVMFASHISRQPLHIQKKFMQVIFATIDSLASYIDNGFVPVGMKDIAHACNDMREVLDDFFPKDNTPTFNYDGTEWEQI